MALLRLVALACIGCRQAAEAGPGSGITPPSGWQPLPALAEAVRAAGGGTSEAWGEPAMGCYAATLAVTGGGTAATEGEQLLASLVAEPALAGIAVRDVVKPASGAATGALTLTFERAPYHGRLRAAFGAGTISALACFWNEREPIACEAACAQLIGSVK